MALRKDDVFFVNREFDEIQGSVTKTVNRSYQVSVQQMEDAYGVGDVAYVSTPLIIMPKNEAGMGDESEVAPEADDVMVMTEPMSGRSVTYSAAEIFIYDKNGDEIEGSPIVTEDDLSLGFKLPPDLLEENTIYQIRVIFITREGLVSDLSSHLHHFRTFNPSHPFTTSNDDIYFDENTYMPITRVDASRKLGVFPENYHLGKIFPLTEQPNYPVLGYTKKKDKYAPIRDYSAEVEYLKSAISAVKTQIRNQP